jgi:hypothetical protein
MRSLIINYDIIIKNQILKLNFIGKLKSTQCIEIQHSMNDCRY